MSWTLLHKRHYNTLLLCIFFFINNHTSIRVLIQEKNILNDKHPHEILFTNTKHLIIEDINNIRCPYEIPDNTISISYKNRKWYLNNKKLGIDTIRLTTTDKNKSITLCGSHYAGTIDIVIKNNTLYIINILPLETYVAGVLMSETYLDWPDESHKVSAIIARTFAYEKIIHNQNNKKLYDIKSSIIHQKYDGICNNVRIQKAVNETKGIIIVYKNKPIIAMYNSCCGGIAPITCRGFDFKGHPYLARPYGCNYCNQCSDYSWSLLITSDTVKKKISQFINKDIDKIHSIKKIKKTRSGTINYIEIEVTVKDKKNEQKETKYKNNQKNITVTLSNKDIRKIFSLTMQNNSAHFSINVDKNGGFIVNGSGRGHHIGLCQHGTKKMAELNKPHQEIIQYYYPCTKLTIINY
jgi:stage II sporulation protein D